MVAMKNKNLKPNNSSSDLFDFADSLANNWKIGAENHISLRRHIVEKMESFQLMRDPFGPIRHIAATLAMHRR